MEEENFKEDYVDIFSDELSEYFFILAGPSMLFIHSNKFNRTDFEPLSITFLQLMVIVVKIQASHPTSNWAY